MSPFSDPLLPVLEEVVRSGPASARVTEALRRVLSKLDASSDVMAWEIIPLGELGSSVPESIRSCWVFGIRARAETGAERHPNSHQRSLSLTGSGVFELHGAQGWTPHKLMSEPTATREQRWVTIPRATWHRLVVDDQAWGMVSFHTARAEELIEERPADAEDLDGETRQERYSGRS